MKKIILISIVCGLLIVMLWQIALLLEPVNNSVSKTSISDDEWLDITIEDLKNIQSQFKGESIPPDIYVFTTDQKKVQLKSLLKSKINIFARYRPGACPDCINNLIYNLQLKKREDPGINIIFLISDINYHDLYVNSKKIGSDFSYFRLDSIFTDNKIHENNPYVFQVNKDSKINSLFICSFENDKGLTDYLNEITLSK